MAIERPDFENWSDEDFETRSDEVCAYVHTLELSDADWMSGAEYRLWLGVQRTLRAEGTADKCLRSATTRPREGRPEDGSSLSSPLPTLAASKAAREQYLRRVP